MEYKRHPILKCKKILCVFILALIICLPIQAFSIEEPGVYSTDNLSEIGYIIEYVAASLENQFTINYIGECNVEVLKDITALSYDTDVISSGDVKASLKNGEIITVDYNLNYYSDFKILSAYFNPKLLNKLTPEEAECMKEVLIILGRNINSNMTDIEVLRTLHDYIIDNTVYSTDTQRDCHTIEAILLESKGVCDAYAKLYALMLNILGYNCNREVGIGYDYNVNTFGRHAWNTIVLNGKVRYIDVTWDDLDRDDRKSYEFFLCVQEEFYKTHTPDLDNSRKYTTWLRHVKLY